MGNLGLFIWAPSQLVVVLLGSMVDPASARPGDHMMPHEAGNALEEVDDERALLDEFTLLEEELSIDEVVSASKHRQSIFWSPSSISVFTREDIRGVSSHGITNLLRRVPNFDVYDIKPSFPFVGARAFTGLSNNLVLAVIDGREELIEMTGFPLWLGFTISQEEMERIEVIRGPGSALYGANAFAAVVNISTLTEKPTRSTDLFLAAGEQGYNNLFGRVRDFYTVGSGTLSMGAAVGASGRYLPSFPGEGADIQHLHGHLRYRLGRKLDISLHGGVGRINGVMVSVAGEARTDGVLNFWEMGKSRIILGEDIELAIQFYHNHFQTNFSFPVGFYGFGMWIFDISDMSGDVDSLDGQVQLNWKISNSLLLLGGANLRYSFMQGSKTMIPRSLQETRGAGFAHLEWNHEEQLMIVGGVRLDLNSVTDAALSPRAAIIYRPWPEHALRLGYSLAFRKPSFMEYALHFKIEKYNTAVPEIVDKMATGLGNKNLKNEKVHSFEAGWRAHFLQRRLCLSLDLFYNLYRDTIEFFVDMPEREGVPGIPDISRSTFQYKNQGAEANAVGGEVELEWRPWEHWKFVGNLGIRGVIQRDTGELMATEPTLRANLGAVITPDTGFCLDLFLHYVSSYQTPLLTPENVLMEREMVTLGNNFLLLAQLGYLVKDQDDHSLEIGIFIRSPLGNAFHEYAGGPVPRGIPSKTEADFMGELVARMVAFYIRSRY